MFELSYSTAGDESALVQPVRWPATTAVRLDRAPTGPTTPLQVGLPLTLTATTGPRRPSHRLVTALKRIA